MPANNPVVAILSPSNISLIFYIPEARLSTIYLGQLVYFICDGSKRKTVAVIHYISPEPEFTPPVNFGKEARYELVYRVQAIMPEEVARQFHPGQPIQVFSYE